MARSKRSKRKPENMQAIAIRFPVQLRERLERLADMAKANANNPLAALGQVSLSQIARLAALRGVAILEADMEEMH